MTFPGPVTTWDQPQGSICMPRSLPAAPSGCVVLFSSPQGSIFGPRSLPSVPSGWTPELAGLPQGSMIIPSRSCTEAHTGSTRPDPAGPRSPVAGIPMADAPEVTRVRHSTTVRIRERIKSPFETDTRADHHGRRGPSLSGNSARTFTAQHDPDLKFEIPGAAERPKPFSQGDFKWCKFSHSSHLFLAGETTLSAHRQI